MTQEPSDAQWATLTVQLETGPIDRPALATAADHLEEVGALLAMDPDVDGVQTLDPKYEAVERPALRVYTRPDALRRIEADARELVAMHGLDAGFSSELRDDTQWQDLWKQFYRPLTFGQGLLLIRPSWIERRPNDPDLEILLDPGRAFGTGLHPTTQLCIEQLCRLRHQGLRPASLLDLGCGSGILSLCSLRLFEGLRRALAVDVDPEATATTLENAECNGLRDRLSIATATLGGLEDERFEVVVANIRPEVLIPIASELRQRVMPRGHLMLSGILPEEAAAVDRAYRDAGWTPKGAVREHEGWSGLDYTHDG